MSVKVRENGQWVTVSAGSGPAGTPGSDGPPGPPGSDGPPGPPGGGGNPGPPGADGNDGADGTPGSDGTPGNDSTTPGPPGPPGSDGSDGADGPPGPTGSPGQATAIGIKPTIDKTASSSGWVYSQNDTRCDYAGIVNDHRDIKCQKLDNDTIYEFRIHANASGGHWGWYISDDNTIGTEGVTAISGGNINTALNSNHPNDNWIGMGDGSNNIVMNAEFNWTNHNTTEKLSGFNWGNQVHVVVDMPQRKVWMKDISEYGDQEQPWWVYSTNQTAGTPVRSDSNPTFFLREDGDMGSLSGDYYFNMAVYVGNQGWIEITDIPQTESVFRNTGGPPGNQGNVGNPGPPGADGNDGADGTPGGSGPPGPPGSDGNDGADGTPGGSGPPGPPGDDGADGADGADGTPGSAGPPGPPGSSSSSTFLGLTDTPNTSSTPGAPYSDGFDKYLTPNQNQTALIWQEKRSVRTLAQTGHPSTTARGIKLGNDGTGSTLADYTVNLEAGTNIEFDSSTQANVLKINSTTSAGPPGPPGPPGSDGNDGSDGSDGNPGGSGPPGPPGGDGPPGPPGSSGSASIPSGSVMLFVQSSAPTGWTKSTSHNNKALRVVSGSGGGSGGSNSFTSNFASRSVSVSGSGSASGTTGSSVSGSTGDAGGETVSFSGSVSGTTDSDGGESISTSGSVSGNCGGSQIMYVMTTQEWLTIDQIPSHNHQLHAPLGTSGGSHGFVDTQNAGSSGTPYVNSTGGSNYHTHQVIMYTISGSNFTFSDSFTATGSTSDHTHDFSDSFSGSGSTSDHSHDIGNHSHSFSDSSISVSSSGSLDLAVQYVDVIICTKS